MVIQLTGEYGENCYQMRINLFHTSWKKCMRVSLCACWMCVCWGGGETLCTWVWGGACIGKVLLHLHWGVLTFGLGRYFSWNTYPEIVFCLKTDTCLGIFELTMGPIRVFFSLGGTGGSPIRQKFCQSPHLTLVPIFGPRLVSPPPPPRLSPKIWKI